MSDEIDDLVDWQLANRLATDPERKVCPKCRVSWSDPITTCPECGAEQ